MLELNLYFAIGETQVQKKCSDASKTHSQQESEQDQNPVIHILPQPPSH